MLKTHFKLRRRWASIAFYTLVATLALVLAMVFFGDETVGQNLTQAAGVVSPILVCLTGLVAQYAYQVQRDDQQPPSD